MSAGRLCHGLYHLEAVSLGWGAWDAGHLTFGRMKDLNSECAIQMSDLNEKLVLISL